MFRRFFITLSIIFVIFHCLMKASEVTSTTLGPCLKQTNCECYLDETWKIDLRPISQELDSKGDSSGNFLSDLVKYMDGNITYYFHGCTNGLFQPKEYHLNTTHLPINASFIAVTMNGMDTPNITETGYEKLVKFEKNNEQSHLALVYHTTQNDTVTASILLICVDYSQTTLVAKNPPEFILFSPYACPKIYAHGISTGTVLLIIFFIMCAFYLLGGALVLYIFRGARNTELIPNADFWRELPGLAKDGAMFLVGGCNTSAISTADTYDRI